MDTQALLQEVFRPREVSTSASVVEFARQRQGVVVAVTAVIGFLILAALHQFVTSRNDKVNSADAVPLTEITDLANQPDETKPQPMPNITFAYDGQVKTMRTFIIEPGAVTPPEVIAAQQAAAAEAAAKKAAMTPAAVRLTPAPNAAQPNPAAPNAPRPVMNGNPALRMPPPQPAPGAPPRPR